MKILKIILIPLFISLVSFYAEDYPIPPNTDLIQYYAQKGKVDNNSDLFSGVYGFPVTRIWGWSKKGEIACSFETAIEGKGGELLQIFIQDLASDEIIWSITEDSNNYQNLKENISFLQNIIALKGIEIFNVFKKHGIIPNNDKFLKLPVKYNNKTFTPSLTLKKEKNPEFNELVTQYSITVKTDDNKSKTIKTEANVKALSVFLCGYFISPYEETAVIIIAQKRFVFEGSELFYSLTGCSLSKGFK